MGAHLRARGAAAAGSRRHAAADEGRSQKAAYTARREQQPAAIYTAWAPITTGSLPSPGEMWGNGEIPAIWISVIVAPRGCAQNGPLSPVIIGEKGVTGPRCGHADSQGAAELLEANRLPSRDSV